MPNTELYDDAKGDEEHILDLPCGRRMAYAQNGPTDARTVVLFFTGALGVGSAARVPMPCQKLCVRWIPPTLSGMGVSSPREKSSSYNVSLCEDMTVLLAFLYPIQDFDNLYVAGVSFGTVPAQMLYGAPYELFPAGRKIVGCLLLPWFAPFKHHPRYTKSLSWQSWFSVGPPSRLPFHLFQRAFRVTVTSKLKTLKGAKTLMRQTLLDEMDAQERDVFRNWVGSHNLTEDTFVEQLAMGAIRCCQRWEGTLEVSDVIHSDWGFPPKDLDQDHSSKPILVVGATNDRLGGCINDWIVENYKSARSKEIAGGHLATLWHMDEIWEELISSKVKRQESPL